MKSFIITEKPSVAKDISGVIGKGFKNNKTYLENNDYVISWAIGHLITLASPDKYDKKYKSWKIEDLPIAPKQFKLVPISSDTNKQLKVLKDLESREDIKETINACDAGREGELIFAYIRDKNNFKKPVKRLWLQSMTNKAISEAFKNLKDSSEYKNLENAAKSRSEADWLVGMNATRAASVKLRGVFDYKSSVSLGRVQTPTLALIVAKEKLIRDFVPVTYYNIDTVLKIDENNSFIARYFDENNENKNKDRITELETAKVIVAESDNKEAVISKMEIKEKKEGSPLLYDLTTLQRECNSRYGYSAKRTLAIAQRLYEHHKLLTYPRTSSRFITDDMVDDVKELISNFKSVNIYNKFATELSSKELSFKKLVNNAKVQDHTAILPTTKLPNFNSLDDSEKRVYDLVVRRMFAIFYEDALWQHTNIESIVDNKHLFKASGKILIKAGWKEVYQKLDNKLKDEDNEENNKNPKKDSTNDKIDTQILPVVKLDDKLLSTDTKYLEKETQPPKRYSDASLLGAMETAGKQIDDAELKEAMKDSGIGTPATRASIIETLIDRGYVERLNKALVATDKAIKIIDFLDSHPLASAELTGKWEKRLNDVEAGLENSDDFMSDIYKFTNSTVKMLANLEPDKIEWETVGTCPKCQGTIKENAKAYSCENEDCDFVLWKKYYNTFFSINMIKEILAKQELENIKFTIGYGRSANKYTSKVVLTQDEDNKYLLQFPDIPKMKEEMIANCPICNKPIRENRKAFSCWSKDDPGCGYTIWKNDIINIDLAKEIIKNGYAKFSNDIETVFYVQKFNNNKWSLKKVKEAPFNDELDQLKVIEEKKNKVDKEE